MFQFLNGSIRILVFQSVTLYGISFQFLNGSIRISECKYIGLAQYMFQFLNGSIRIETVIQAKVEVECFNS